MGPWGQAFNRAIARGHDHGSAAEIADRAEQRAAKNCPSTHCERRQECASPHECIVQKVKP